jgi:hypothetical protein
LLRRHWQVGGAQVVSIPKAAALAECAHAEHQRVAAPSNLPQIVAVCSCCKKLRGNDGAWYTWEEYLDQHGIQISHGMCEGCGETLYPWRKKATG